MPVSDITFQNRINFLVEVQGIERQAQFYGVTRRTIRRWQGGETRPSARVRDSVRRRGLTAGAEPAEQRREGGRFTAPERDRFTAAFNVERSINRERRRTRNAAIRDAQLRGNVRSERMARALPSRISENELRALLDRRERLLAGEEEESEWGSWRADYYAYVGR
tara:strand:+ start:1284 stop:1778 length:495 start_codon:yes stop_codon:yes gene_type:complete